MPTQSENETMSSNTVAMWVAISNPLLLISQVLRKSMELQEPDQKNTTSVTPTTQCEFTIEQHAAPQLPSNIHRYVQMKHFVCEMKRHLIQLNKEIQGEKYMIDDN